MSNAAQQAFSLTGKTILVTGASSGIGRQIAVSCSRRGARLVVTGRDAERLQETYSLLKGQGHVQVLANLTEVEGRERLVQRASSVDGLVHCAGRQRLSPIRQLAEKLMTDVYAVNFLAPVMLTQRMLQANALAPQSSIVFILSTAAHIGTPGVGPYSAMKSALLGIIRCLSMEQAKRKVRVNGISPSAVATPIWDAVHLEAQRKRHPLGLGTPDDVANAAIFLLSDASRWVTGTSLVMDGGAVL
ncbi:SDR family NAD(P)-dependent oxidoreductase [Xanthomonas theicola]|uniref:3-oxoacyl-ACP reductase n=1 Tax=Xanthomonas theicola TaxID=56464 RepID=A0A2S6ZEW0_9XANT|nr:SDR family oxidoreductase [Xanthomonas theicola]PPT90689.1 3-oxoacyl-ACP reductase [Xanthomonas theicola]QNH24909.1 SDR family oxidoreductase [Xanthomonas theicola]